MLNDQTARSFVTAISLNWLNLVAAGARALHAKTRARECIVHAAAVATTTTTTTTSIVEYHAASAVVVVVATIFYTTPTTRRARDASLECIPKNARLIL